MVEYGSYLKYKDGDEEKAKRLLKKQLHELIDCLCENEDFWIKQERDRTGKDLLRRANTIGWKIAIPSNNFKGWSEKQPHGKRLTKKGARL